MENKISESPQSKFGDTICFGDLGQSFLERTPAAL